MKTMTTCIIVGSMSGFFVFLVFGLLKGTNPSQYDKGYMDGWDKCELSHLKKKTK